jgi:putative IMPACT (imprinted ancient) family translation regulator
MNADVAITIIFGGWVASVAIAGGIFAWYSARASKALRALEQLNRKRPTRAQPRRL